MQIIYIEEITALHKRIRCGVHICKRNENSYNQLFRYIYIYIYKRNYVFFQTQKEMGKGLI